MTVVPHSPLHEAADALRAGLPVVVPTDTVVGLGVAVGYAADARVLARIKGRDEAKPVAWLIGSAEDLDIYGEDVPGYAHDLAQEGWPGALTLIVKASSVVPQAYRSQAGTIGLRVPDSRTIKELIAKVGSPLAVTSANRAGEAAPCTLDGVTPEFAEQAHRAGAVFLFASGEGSGSASTVIDCTHPEPKTLRS